MIVFVFGYKKMCGEISFRSRPVAPSGSVWSSSYDRFCVWMKKMAPWMAPIGLVLLKVYVLLYRLKSFWVVGPKRENTRVFGQLWSLTCSVFS